MKRIVKIHSKIRIWSVVCFLMIFAVVMTVSINHTDMAFAETSTKKAITNVGNESVSPLGLYTHLTLNINGGDGKVWATVKNDVTLFPSKVVVIVELYSSDTYHESYLDMNLVGTNSTDDLNMGKSIVVEYSTGGIQKYWQARMRYKVDNGGWKSESTRTILCGPMGDYLG